MTSVPRAPVEWWCELGMPSVQPGGPAFSPGLVIPRFHGAAPGTAVTNLNAGGTGGAGVTADFNQRAGRWCFRARTTGGANRLTTWAVPWWQFHAGAVQAGSFDGGYEEFEPSRVAWWRVAAMINVLDAALTTTAGFYFVPFELAGGTNVMGTLSADNSLPAGPAFKGGHGVTMDGANAWQFASWDAAGVLQHSVAIPTTVADPLAWSIFDFVYRCSTPSSLGSLSLTVNGTAIMTEQAFDAVDLFGPQDLLGPFAHGFAFASGQRAPFSATFFYHWFHARFGRFLPDGRLAGTV